MENNLRESFIRTKDPIETKYLKYIDWEFDYEINNFTEDSNENFSSKLGNSDQKKKISENENNNTEYNNINNKLLNNLENFSDEFAPRFYKCENVFCLKKKYIKSIISKNKIRLINKDFDLDLM